MKILTCAAAVLILTPGYSNRLSNDAQQQSQSPVVEQGATTSTPAPVEEQPAAQAQAPPRKPKQKKPVPEPAPVGTTHAVVDGKLVNVDAEAIKDFKDRVDKYVSVHNKAKGDAPPLKETTDPAKIKTAENELAAQIRGLRADA